MSRPMSRSVRILFGLFFVASCGDADEASDSTGTDASATSTGTSTDSSATSTGTGPGTTTEPTATSTSDGTTAADTTGASSGSSGPVTTGTSSRGSESSTGSDTDEDAQCFPNGGIYGSCAESPTCQCLTGANVYQACTISCTDSSECGDAADFPGAMPGCFPLNPGVADMICALVCESEADCPCGLPCMPSGVPNVSICAEAQ